MAEKFFTDAELREIMARLGFRTLNEMIGRVDRLDMRRALDHWKAGGVDLSKLLYQAPAREGVAIWNVERQDHGLDKALDHRLIEAARPALEKGEPVLIELPITNVNRTVGAMLSGEVAKRAGHTGLAEDTITVKLNGTAGQSFGAFLARGVSLELSGDGNDYVGKGLSGGRVVVRQPKGARRNPVENIIVGNTVLYGAIGGEAYFEGVAGERFAVRNSGAVCVVEGTGDHGCEYMTGGVVVVLGDTGRNFAAGMSGGIAYVYDPKSRFKDLCNPAMVDLESVGRPSGDGDDPDRPRQRAPSVEDNGMGDVLRFDAERLRILVERHHLHTGSARARALLEDWENALQSFVKVMPRDYKRALLQARERATAKAVAAGFPLALVAGRRDVMDTLLDKGVMHGGTYNGNVQSMAAALTALDILEADNGAIYRGMEACGRQLMDGLSALGAKHGLAMLVQGMPAIFQTFFTSAAAPRNYRDSMATDRDAMLSFHAALQEEGVRVQQGGRWFLSTAHDRPVIDETLAAADRAMAKMVRR